VPLTVSAIAREAAAAALAGADDLHVHAKDDQGRDTLDSAVVARTLAAVREACGRLSVGVTTGAWAASESMRQRLVQAWVVLPDHVSVNLHEPGAVELAGLCLARGIAVDAGLWTGTAGLDRFLASDLQSLCRRVLVEVTEADPAAAVQAAQAMLTRIALPPSRILLHGEGPATWHLVREAARLGCETRIGFEDTLALPDGCLAQSNAELVAAACQILASVPPSP
jgi:uncharacterized protein (DUF849 family)